MSNYKNKILKWLKDDYIYADRDRSDIDIHVDEFLGENCSYSVYITEGIKILDTMVEIARENDWLDDFKPVLRINLNDKRTLKKIKISSIDDIARDMDNSAIPEIILWPKIILTDSYHEYVYHEYIEVYKRNLRREFCEIFGRDFGYEYSIYYEMEYCVGIDGYKYRQREIYIEYNENNSEVVKNVRRLTLKEN
jgi:hypothetical protein